MKHKLEAVYDINIHNKTFFNSREAYLDNDYMYFVIPTDSNDTVHMEQAALAYYLSENNYPHMAYPIQTKQGEWFVTDENNEQCMVVRIIQQKEHPQYFTTQSHGLKLAEFHRLGFYYKFQPQKISSYGQWKNLWIEKLTMFESFVQQEIKKNNHRFYRFVLDILPYIIGISENAIQYIGNSESETRFDAVDQGTFTFRRYNGQLQSPIIWPNDLHYDHPTRDLAEYIRYKYLLCDNEDTEEIVTFINDYQKRSILSIFSWQQLYARLLFPVHFFDCLQDGIAGRLDKNYNILSDLVARQPYYEVKLKRVFQLFNVDHINNNIPVVEWL